MTFLGAPTLILSRRKKCKPNFGDFKRNIKVHNKDLKYTASTTVGVCFNSVVEIIICGD